MGEVGCSFVQMDLFSDDGGCLFPVLKTYFSKAVSGVTSHKEGRDVAQRL